MEIKFSKEYVDKMIKMGARNIYITDKGGKGMVKFDLLKEGMKFNSCSSLDAYENTKAEIQRRE